MATIIDQLFITLGLKTDGFEKGAKKATDSLKKVDDASEKTQKNVQLNAKKTSDSFENAFESLTRFGAALVSIGAAKQFIQSQVETHAQLGRTSQLLNVGVKDLDAWGAAAKSTGGDSKSFIGAVQNIYEGLAKFRVGLGGQEVIQTLARLGVEAKDGKVDINELAVAIKRVRDAEGELVAKSLAQTLGFDESSYFLLTKNQDELEKLVESMKRLSGASDNNSESAQRLISKWATLKQEISGFAGVIFDTVAPALEKMLDLLNKVFDKTDRQKGAESIRKKDLFAASMELPAGDFLKSIFKIATGSSAEEVANGLKARQSASGKIQYPNQGSAQDSTDNRGQSGLPRGLRNNNPGNIEYGAFAQKHGAVGSDGRFAIFPDMQTGKNAMSALLESSYLNKGYDTIGKIINKYAPGSENNTAGYIDRVSKESGISPNQQLTSADLAKVQNAMMNVENGRAVSPVGDFKKNLPNLNETLPPVGAANYDALNKGSGGNVTNSTNIQNVNVYTQATDALGVANGMRDALAKNQLINYGAAGAK